MTFDYITKDSPNHMTSFFSSTMLRTYFTVVWLLGLGLIVFWPKKAFYVYLQIGTEPFCASGLYMAGLLILSYINLMCGRGEFTLETDPIARKKNSYLEEQRGFFSYGLMAFIIHTLLFISLMMPFFLIAESVSGAPIQIFFRYLLILFLTALLFRLIGFTGYLCIGRWHNLSYILTRLLFVFFFFLSSKFAPAFNPLSLIYSLPKTRMMSDVYQTGGGAGYLALVAGAGAVFILLNSYIIQRKHTKGYSV